MVKREIVAWKLKANKYLADMAEALNMKTGEDRRTLQDVVDQDPFRCDDDSDDDAQNVVQANEPLDDEIIRYNNGATNWWLKGDLVNKSHRFNFID